MNDLPAELFLEPYPAPIREISEQLRVIIRFVVPAAIEAVRPGWRLIGYDVPAGKKTTYFAYVAPETEHAHLGFEHGASMDDPDGLLVGEGITRQVRWLTFRPGEMPETDLLAPLIREAARVALMTRSERLARLLDREAVR